jgi:replicative DNA helicase Mcm
MDVRDAELAALWGSYFKAVTPVIEKAQRENASSLIVPFAGLLKGHGKLADLLLEKPRQALQVGAHVLHGLLGKQRMHLRVAYLHDAGRRDPAQVLSRDLGRLVQIRGKVLRASQPRPSCLEAAFDCKTCGNRIRLVQDDELLSEPVICDGCDRPGPWTLREEECRFIDAQAVTIEGGGALLEVAVHDDLVNLLPVGRNVDVVGIVTARRRRRGAETETTFDFVLQAVSVGDAH